MIIRGVQAERLHKYRSLRLTDLPERGVIAVSGDNETGKSAIGELICFALFGRSYVLAEDRIGKLVHWGAAQGSVTLSFCVRGGSYEVTRHVARDGEQSARLLCTDASGEPLARGTDAVTREVERVLGFGFDEYIETFYLAQREITTPHPHSPAFKSMVGIAPFERCTVELGDEAQQEEESARVLDDLIGELDRRVAALGTDRERLDELEADLAEAAATERDVSTRRQALQLASDAYCRDCHGRRGRSLRKALAGFSSTLLVLAMLLGAAFWAMLKYEPELWPVPALRGQLERVLSNLGLALDAAMTYAAIAVGGMLVLIWLWMFFLSIRDRRRRARARRLAEEFDLLDELDPEPAVAADLAEETLADGVRLEAPGLVDRPDSERRSRLQRRVVGLSATAVEVKAALKHELAWLSRRLQQLGEQREESERLLERARSDEQEYRRLREERDELRRRLVEHRERIATRNLACELLDGAAKEMSDSFSEHLRSMVSKALPQFTEGRYEHLQVDDEFQLRIYSPDKRNLLDLDEISSGTQRQIMLALRLGLGQELVARRVKDTQFAFLDEPFAFSDGARMRAALRSLTELGGDVVQYWVVAQRIPQDARISLEIRCGEHPDTLEVGHPAAA